MAGLRKVHEDDKTATKGGVLGAIKEGEKMDVFLARGCGELQVELCAGVYGKELFDSIKEPDSTRSAASTSFVGQSSSLIWLTRSSPQTVPPPSRSRSNPGAPLPSTRSKRGCSPGCGTQKTRSEFSGPLTALEHVPERMEFLRALTDANEEDENAYPTAYCIKLFEELTAEQRRQLGKDNPCLDDLKLVALAPGPDGSPNFQFPKVWALDDPSGYYQRVVVPRQQQAMHAGVLLGTDPL